jgi:hypothetical protein
MVVLALARDPMMGHARPPVNKRAKLRTTTPLDGSARPPEGSREFGYTAPARRPQRHAVHFIKCLLATLITYTNASRRRVPSPAPAGDGTRRDVYFRSKAAPKAATEGVIGAGVTAGRSHC